MKLPIKVTVYLTADTEIIGKDADEILAIVRSEFEGLEADDDDAFQLDSIHVEHVE